MRRTLAAAFFAVAVATTPAAAEDPILKWVRDQIDNCMDCVPPPCQILLGSCAKP